jgi:HK97 family phage major capsid protein
MPQTTLEQRRDMSADELRERAAEMRSEWAELAQSDRESDDFRSAKREFLAEIDDIDLGLTLRALAEERAMRQLGTRPGVPAAGLATTGDAVETRSVGQLFTQDERVQNWARTAIGGQVSESPVIEVRTLVTSGTTGTSAGGLLAPVGQPFLAPVNRQRLVIRDLLAVNPVDGRNLLSIPYVREKNSDADNAAGVSTVAEGSPKPEGQLEWDPDSATMQVIATVIPVTNQILRVLPSIQTYIDNTLLYRVALAEEKQILNGTGTGTDLKGIYRYNSGGYQIQTQSATANDPAVSLANAFAKIENANGVADGVAMNPADFWTMVSKRASGGSGTFDAGEPFTSVPQTVWGLPAVRTKSMAAGKALPGAWKMAATLFDGEIANVRIFEQHSDFAMRNQVLIRAEETVALAVLRPDWFVDTSL